MNYIKIGWANLFHKIYLVHHIFSYKNVIFESFVSVYLPIREEKPLKGVMGKRDSSE